MRRMDFARFRSVRLPIGSGSLLLLFFASVFGILLGYRFAAGAQPFLAPELAEHFAAYAAGTEPASAATVLHTFFSFLRAPMFAFLLGFSLPGVLLLPLLCAFESFSLSFSYFSFVSAAAPGNFGRVLLLFSGRIFLIFPSLLLLASCSWEASRALLASGGGKRMIPAVYGAAYWIRAAVCTAVLLLGAAAELWLIPGIFRSALL